MLLTPLGYSETGPEGRTVLLLQFADKADKTGKDNLT
jgi:hypothetical protein